MFEGSKFAPPVDCRRRSCLAMELGTDRFHRLQSSAPVRETSLPGAEPKAELSPILPLSSFAFECRSIVNGQSGSLGYPPVPRCTAIVAGEDLAAEFAGGIRHL